jgi:putative redox protein
MSALEGTVELVEGMTFSATSGTGHTLTLDAASDVGGANRGPRPMELLLLGLGGCTGMDVISILRKMRQEVTGYQIRVRGERAETHPKIFTTITVEHIVRGRNLNPDSIRRAVELSATRYCSASAMLSKSADVEERFRVIDEATGTETVGTLDTTADVGTPTS